MIERIKQSRLIVWTRSYLVPTLFRHRVFGMAVVATLLAVLYWGLIASDRYVSEAHVIIQNTDFLSGQSATDLGALLGNSNSTNRADQLLLRDHLLSIDMLMKLDDKLKLRQHYSNWRRDPLSRMWFENAPIEWFHRHYLSRVSVEFDDFSGILMIKAQGYDAKMAHAIAKMLVEEGERFMNDTGHDLARVQVAFLERQVTDMAERVFKTRQAVLEFQNQKGLVSPQGTVENLATAINKLEARRVELQTRRATLLGRLAPQSPDIVEINQQITAVEQQIDREKSRLVSPTDKTLNRVVEEFQRLQMDTELAQEVYKTALVALERGRLDVTRTLKKVSVLQSPFEPKYPVEPRRIYNIIVFILVVLLMAGITHLLASIVQDHKE